MPILIRCEHCARKLNVPDEALGKRVRCPNCSEVTAVRPAAPAEAPAPAGRPGRVNGQARQEAPEAVAEAVTAFDEEPIAPRKPADRRSVEQEAFEDADYLDEGERVTARKPSPARRPRLDDEEDFDDEARQDGDPGAVRPKSQLVLRLFVLVLGLLGAVFSAKEGLDIKSTFEKVTANPGKFHFLDEKGAKANYDAYPYMLAGAGVGLVGGLLGFLRFGLIGGPLMLASVVAPAIYHPATFLVTGFFVLGGLLCFFVRSKKRALAAAVRAAESGKEPSGALRVLGIIGASLAGLIILAYAGLIGYAMFFDNKTVLN